MQFLHKLCEHDDETLKRSFSTIPSKKAKKRKERKTADGNKDVVIGHYINFMVNILDVLYQHWKFSSHYMVMDNVHMNIHTNIYIYIKNC